MNDADATDHAMLDVEHMTRRPNLYSVAEIKLATAVMALKARVEALEDAQARMERQSTKPLDMKIDPEWLLRMAAWRSS